MTSLTQDELAAIRGRHHRAARGEDHEAEMVALVAHQDRERLLAAVEELGPVLDAARAVARLIQRGPLPSAARRALLELHVALDGTGLDGAGLDGAGLDGVGLDDAGLDDAGLDELELLGQGPDDHGMPGVHDTRGHLDEEEDLDGWAPPERLSA